MVSQTALNSHSLALSCHPEFHLNFISFHFLPQIIGWAHLRNTEGECQGPSHQRHFPCGEARQLVRIPYIIIILDGVPFLLHRVPHLLDGMPTTRHVIPGLVGGSVRYTFVFVRLPQRRLKPKPQTPNVGSLTRDIEDVVVYYCGEREGEKIPPPTGSTSAGTTTPSVSRQVRIQRLYGRQFCIFSMVGSSAPPARKEPNPKRPQTLKPLKPTGFYGWEQRVAFIRKNSKHPNNLTPQQTIYRVRWLGATRPWPGRGRWRGAWRLGLPQCRTWRA